MKKNNIILIVFLFISVSIVSCKKDTLDVSKVTTYPILTLLGDQYMTIAQGATYTEPGVSATIGGAAVDFTTTGTVNSATPGVYILEYKAINAEGFFQTAKRYVGVIAPDAAASNLSGVWKRTNNVETNWTKVTSYNGLYTTDNVGGVADPTYVYDVRIFNTNDSTIVIPLQTNPLGGEVFCDNISLQPSTGLGKVVWIVRGTGYGTSLRTFNKQ